MQAGKRPATRQAAPLSGGLQLLRRAAGLPLSNAHASSTRTASGRTLKASARRPVRDSAVPSNPFRLMGGAGCDGFPGQERGKVS